jgi:hypothetical protein
MVKLDGLVGIRGGNGEREDRHVRRECSKTTADNRASSDRHSVHQFREISTGAA